MTTRFCKACFAPLKMNSLHAFLYRDLCLCDKCLASLDPKLIHTKIDGVKGICLYLYRDTVKEKIYTLKGCGDIELAQIFLNYYQHELRHKYRGYIILPAPSDEEANQKRGFNHVQEIFKVLNCPIYPLIQKKEAFKQSDLSKSERAKIKDKLFIKDIDKLRHKKVLFVDDILTTGSTLKACLSLIKSAQPRCLSFLIIAKVNQRI